MDILMHICCANCAVYPLQDLRKRGVSVKGLWFNPNIHPEEEYRLRLGALRDLQDRWGLDVQYAGQYGLDEFLEAVEDHSGIRCEACYRIRLGETARRARAMGMDGFSTTLLVSPYQKFDLIAEMGRRMQEKYSVEFLLQDFRPGWRAGMSLSRQFGLYRQRYCGCVFSKQERQEQDRMKHMQKEGAAG